MGSDAEPVVGGLQREMNVFAGFQFENREAAVARHSQQIDHAAIAGGKCGHLRVQKTRIEPRINSRGIDGNQFPSIALPGGETSDETYLPLRDGDGL